jgi:hypothetical protein
MGLSPDLLDRYLRAIHRALIFIRDAAGNGDSRKAFAIADAFENLPLWLTTTPPDGLKDAHQIYLQPLLQEYPELQGLIDAVPRT